MKTNNYKANYNYKGKKRNKNPQRVNVYRLNNNWGGIGNCDGGFGGMVLPGLGGFGGFNNCGGCDYTGGMNGLGGFGDCNGQGGFELPGGFDMGGFDYSGGFDMGNFDFSGGFDMGGFGGFDYGVCGF